MAHTRAQRQLVATEEGTDSEWADLPEELKLKVLDREWTRRDSAAVRGTCRRWRAMHDASCKTLRVRDGVPDEEVICSLCGRLPALTSLDLERVKSLTTEGLRAVGGMTTLTHLDLTFSNVTNVGLRELRGLTALSTLYLPYCPSVTDVGLQELTTLTVLTRLGVYGCSTSKAGRDSLEAAIPGLTILS
jgi:Leucine-rich repeat (LRR) protein